MTKEQKDKYIAYSVVGISLCCYLFAIAFHDIPSYEQDYLEGIPWILYWSMVLYLPLFPLLAGLLVIVISNEVTSKGITTANFALTLLFAIFAFGAEVFSISWLLLTITSLLPMLAAYYDKQMQPSP